MDNKRKIIDDFQVPSTKYRVIVVESIPNIIFNKVKIKGQIYELVPIYDLKNSIAFEYDGDDFEADMDKMAADPATQRWWDVVKPLMQPLEDRAEGDFWSDMTEIYHLD